MARFSNLIRDLRFKVRPNFDEEIKQLLELKKEDENELLESIAMSEFCFGQLILGATGARHFFRILDHLKNIFSQYTFDIIIDRQQKFQGRNNLIIDAFQYGTLVTNNIQITFDIIEKYFDREFYLIYQEQGFRDKPSILHWIIYNYSIHGKRYIMNAFKERNLTDAEFDISIIDKIWDKYHRLPAQSFQ